MTGSHDRRSQPASRPVRRPRGAPRPASGSRAVRQPRAAAGSSSTAACCTRRSTRAPRCWSASSSWASTAATSTSSSRCAWPGLKRQVDGRLHRAHGRRPDGRGPADAHQRRRCGSSWPSTATRLVHDVLPALAAHGVHLVIRLSATSTGGPRAPGPLLPGQRLPGADPAGGRSGPPVPLHLEPEPLHRGGAARPRRRGALRAGEGAEAAAALGAAACTPNTFVPLEQVVGRQPRGALSRGRDPGLAPVPHHAQHRHRDRRTATRPKTCCCSSRRKCATAASPRWCGSRCTTAMPQSLRQLLLAEFNEEQQDVAPPLTNADIFEVQGLLDTADLLTSRSALDLPALKDPPFHAATPHRLAQGRNIFEVHPRGRRAAASPVRQLRVDGGAVHPGRGRRPGRRSPSSSRSTARAATRASRALLLQAAERGKQVAVLIELQARFDEENNIAWAKRLEDVGVHVSYGVAGLKTHAKMLLVVRREGDFIRRYVHIGTGNYNPKTARLYTDFGLLSCRPRARRRPDRPLQRAHRLRAAGPYRQMLVAPRYMRERFLADDPPRDRAPAGGPRRAHPRQDERAGGSRHHRGALRGVARRGADRPDRPRHLLPAARRAGRERRTSA